VAYPVFVGSRQAGGPAAPNQGADMAEDNKTPEQNAEIEQADSVLDLQNLKKDEPEVEAHGCVSGVSISIN